MSCFGDVAKAIQALAKASHRLVERLPGALYTDAHIPKRFLKNAFKHWKKKEVAFLLKF